MSTSDLSSQEIRAAAEAHRELGPEYHDAVVESFLAKVEKVIEARVDARLAASPLARRRLDPATLARRRLVLKYMAVGSVAAAIPFTFVSLWAHGNTGNGAAIGDWTGTVVSLVVMWVLIGVVYGLCAFRLLAPRSDRDDN